MSENNFGFGYFGHSESLFEFTSFLLSKAAFRFRLEPKTALSVAERNLSSRPLGSFAA
jgi:hypothetical protein